MYPHQNLHSVSAGKGKFPGFVFSTRVVIGISWCLFWTSELLVGIIVEVEIIKGLPVHVRTKMIMKCGSSAIETQL